MTILYEGSIQHSYLPTYYNFFKKQKVHLAINYKCVQKADLTNKNIPGPLDWNYWAEMRIDEKEEGIHIEKIAFEERNFKDPNSLTSPSMTFVCVDGLLTYRMIQASSVRRHRLGIPPTPSAPFLTLTLARAGEAPPRL